MCVCVRQSNPGHLVLLRASEHSFPFASVWPAAFKRGHTCAHILLWPWPRLLKSVFTTAAGSPARCPPSTLCVFYVRAPPLDAQVYERRATGSGSCFGFAKLPPPTDVDRRFSVISVARRRISWKHRHFFVQICVRTFGLWTSAPCDVTKALIPPSCECLPEALLQHASKHV